MTTPTPAFPPPPPKKGKGKTVALTLLGLLIFGGCVSAVGGGDEDKPAASSATTTEVDKPAPAAKPKNPLDTSDNQLACNTSRREVGERAEIFTQVGEGTALPADGAKAAKELQKDTGDAGSYATGGIRLELLKLSDAYGRMRVGLATGDLESLSQGVAEQNAALEELGSLCESIGA